MFGVRNVETHLSSRLRFNKTSDASRRNRIRKKWRVSVNAADVCATRVSVFVSIRVFLGPTKTTAETPPCHPSCLRTSGNAIGAPELLAFGRAPATIDSNPSDWMTAARRAAAAAAAASRIIAVIRPHD